MHAIDSITSYANKLQKDKEPSRVSDNKKSRTTQETHPNAQILT